MKYKCLHCGYEGLESQFFDGYCPACVRDIDTGKENDKLIPSVFYYPDVGTIEYNEYIRK